MSTVDVPVRIESLQQGALRHQIVRQLLRTIFEGGLPAGTRLVVLKLADWFGTSSTPVREALVELAGIGMVEFIHNRGAEVVPFGSVELREIYQLRRILEVEATRNCCGRVDMDQFRSAQDEMLNLVRNRRGDGWSEMARDSDRRLHELIVNSCGSKRLIRELHRYGTLVEMVREIVGQDRPSEERALMEHLAVLDSLLSGDCEAAAAEMAKHIDSSEQAAQAILFPE